MVRGIDAQVSLEYIYSYIQTVEVRSDLLEPSAQTVEHGRAKRLRLAQTAGIDCLEELMAGQGIYLAEWSTSFCD